MRRFLIGAAILFGLLAAFHRPIFFEATRYFVLRAAKQQNLDLTYAITGTIFTRLSVTNLKATPTEPGPIQRLEIKAINLHYSLIDLVRKGLPAFLRTLEIRDLHLELTPTEPLPAAKETEPQRFKFPALFPAKLILDNINVRVHLPTGDGVLEGLAFRLLPDRAGTLTIQTLDIPGVRRWTDLAATTTYRDRNLILTDFVLDQEIALRELNVNMTQLDDAKLGLVLEGTFFQAPVRVTASVTDLNASNRLSLQAAVGRLVFNKVWSYLNMPPPFQGRLEELAVTFAGAPDNPREWTGEVRAALGDITAGKRRLGDANLSATFASGKAEATVRNLFDDRNSLFLSVKGSLPEALDQIVQTKATGRIELSMPEAERMTVFLPELVVGDLSVKTDFSLDQGWLKSRTTLEAQKLAVAQAELTQMHFVLDAEKDLTADSAAPVFQGLTTRLEGGAATIRGAGYESEAVALLVSSVGPTVKLEHLRLAKGKNRVTAAGSYELPEDLESWHASSAEGSFTVDAPDLSAFVTPESGVLLKGLVTATGQAQLRDKTLTGSLMADGSGIELNGFPVRSLKIRSVVRDNHASISELGVILDEANHIRGAGEVQFGEPLVYQGHLDILLKDLGVFRPILPSGGPDLGGALTVQWSGSGDSRTPGHAGEATVSLINGRVGGHRNLSANFHASYTADFLHVPDVTFSAGSLGNAAFSLSWKENRLRLSHLAVRQNQTMLLTGDMDLPLHLAKFPDINALIPSHEPLTLTLQGANLDLAALARNTGRKDPPVTGRAAFALKAHGTLDDLLAQFTLRGTNLRATALRDAAPAEIAVDLDLREDDRLHLDGTVRQKMIEPLRITGELPLDVAAILARRTFDPATPVDLSLSLPRSATDFVATMVPAIRASRGHLAANVRVKGSLAQPDLSGDVTAEIAALRFVDPNVPAINAAALRLDFRGNTVTVTRCSGVLGGGNFAASGRVIFEQLDNPVLNLAAGTRNALFLQNDDMTVRASSDLRITGPLNTALVEGTVWVTRSRFFRNIDILPIGLPGRPAPQPPGPPVVVSLRDPPLRDWTFDVTIKTLDPFLVQGNLANGRIVMDLNLGGSGLKPWVEGTVTIEQLTASLPFSRLEITDGQVFFTRNEPFLPQLNLRGTSTVRDYNVSVFISGPVTTPEAVFTSDPPLPQAEVVSLLATGMTTSELSHDPNAIAGRAAILLFQRLYHSVFHPNRPPPDTDDFLSRIRFDIGVTDPKTGRQSTTLGIPLSENVVLMGGLDVGGNFQGQVKYLIRFK